MQLHANIRTLFVLLVCLFVHTISSHFCFAFSFCPQVHRSPRFLESSIISVYVKWIFFPHQAPPPQSHRGGGVLRADTCHKRGVSARRGGCPIVHSTLADFYASVFFGRKSPPPPSPVHHRAVSPKRPIPPSTLFFLSLFLPFFLFANFQVPKFLNLQIPFATLIHHLCLCGGEIAFSPPPGPDATVRPAPAAPRPPALPLRDGRPRRRVRHITHRIKRLDNQKVKQESFGQIIKIKYIYL